MLPSSQIFVLLQFDPGLEYYKAAQEGRPGPGRRGLPIGGPGGGPGGPGGHHGQLINTSIAGALPPPNHSVPVSGAGGGGPGGMSMQQGGVGVGGPQGAGGPGGPNGPPGSMGLMGNPMQQGGPGAHPQGGQPPS